MSEQTMDRVVRGAVWRSKRRGEFFRVVTLTSNPWESYRGVSVSVRRNTSRRKQAITVKTLLKDYRFDRMEPDA